MAKENNVLQIHVNDKILEQKGVITLAGAYGKITLLGTDLRTSIEPGEKVDSFYLVPPKEEKDEGVVAVSVESDKGNERQMFLRIFSENSDKVHIVDHEEWIPSQQRLANIIDGYIVVRSEGKLFTNDEKYAEEKNGYYIPDANLLCRFINGKAHESDLMNKAIAHKEEISALEERPKLLDKIEKIERQNQWASNKLGYCQSRLNKISEKILNLEEEIQKRFFSKKLKRRIREIRELVLSTDLHEDY